MRNPTTKFLTTLVLLSLSGSAFAHPGHDASGLVAGLLHPFSGMDHLLAMLAVGLWAGQSGTRKLWLLPVTFMLLLVVGAGVALLLPELPLIETGIAASVLVLGLITALALYALGFLGATATLHFSGITLGLAARGRFAVWTQAAGAAIALSGIWMLS